MPFEALIKEACCRFRWTPDQARSVELYELQDLIWYHAYRERVIAERQNAKQ